jgi:uncharacterized protein
MKNKLLPARLAAGIMILAMLFAFLPGMRITQPVLAAGETVFINEIHYDNTGTDTGEAVEIAGLAGTDLTGWSLVLYNGSNGSVYDTTNLSGSITDSGNGFGFMVINYPVNGLQNGSPDGLALVDDAGSVIQFLSYEGSFTAADGPAVGQTSIDIGVSESSSTPVDYSLQLTGTGSNYSDFTWVGPFPGTFGVENSGQVFEAVTNLPVLITCGSPLTFFQGNSTSTNVSASDSDGIVVSMEISEISPDAPVGSIVLSDFVAAGSVGGTATATLTANPSLPSGVYVVTLTAANNDATPQISSCKITMVVKGVLTIGEVQGEVTDDADGLTFDSPYNGQYVTIQGVIYENTLARTSSGDNSYGFFVQNTTTTADGNPNTSDGIFVYIGSYSTLRVRGGGYYTPKVGDEVILNGRISEYYHLTELSNPYLETIVRPEVDLNAEVPTFEVNPPADLASANRYWERHEGMRAEIPAGSITTSGRDVFASTADSEIWLIRGDSEVAQRADPYARRVFRDAHPLDDIPDQLFDNGNGYRFLLGGMGVKATENDNRTLLTPARTFDTLTNSLIGGVYFSFSKYQIQVEQQPDFENGVNPAENNPPQEENRSLEYSIITYNLENLYDYRDDPNDGCDFTGNSGCPGVYPPFDYVPDSNEAYQARLDDIANQVNGDLHDPDIIMAQEIEDQDICKVDDQALVCDTSGENLDRDGKPDTLQELALRIAEFGGPQYDAAYDPDGADDRGIVSGFLFRTDRAQLLPAQANDPVLGDNPQVIYPSDPLPFNTDVENPKALNAVLPDFVDRSTGTDGDNVFTRAPEVGLFRLWRDGIGTSVFTDLYLIDNHFSSGPDSRVGQRTEQAAYNAAIVDALQSAYPGVYVSVGGDLNVYPRPDDPFTPGDPLFPSDQLGALYNQGMTNLYDKLVEEVPVSAYSYVYQGQAQTLDQMFVTPSLLEELVAIRAAHINSDWPKDYLGDGARGTSDHDPQVASYSLLPTLDRLEALVHYYVDNGDITGNKTEKILLDFLERARTYQESGQQSAYLAQLLAFGNQVQGFAPKFVTQEAADALQQEAVLLSTLP